MPVTEIVPLSRPTAAGLRINPIAAFIRTVPDCSSITAYAQGVPGIRTVVCIADTWLVTSDGVIAGA